MRHRVAGKHLNRTPSHRRALRRNLASSLFQYGAIRTTEAKAKDVRRFAEKLITTAKKGTLHARRLVIAELQDREIFTYDEASQDYLPEDMTVVQKLFDEIAPRYANRNGGYTRIIRISDHRIGDGGVQVVLQLVEEDAAAGGSTGGKRSEKAKKRIDAASYLKESAKEEAPAAEEAPAEEPVEEAQTEAPAEEATEEKTEE